MSQKYLLPCSCGKSIPVETSQAGQDIQCDCGLTVKVPSLLKIKQLPKENAVQQPLVSKETPISSEQQQQQQAGGLSPKKQWNYSAITICTLLLIISCFYCVKTVLTTYPKPEEVLYKQEYFRIGDTWTFQNSDPLPMSERNFFAITDEQIDAMLPLETFSYWNIVKVGPAMSLNFRETYQTLIDMYYIRSVATGVLVAISLGLLIGSLFLGKAKIISDRKGMDWK